MPCVVVAGHILPTCSFPFFLASPAQSSILPSLVFAPWPFPPPLCPSRCEGMVSTVVSQMGYKHRGGVKVCLRETFIFLYYSCGSARNSKTKILIGRTGQAKDYQMIVIFPKYYIKSTITNIFKYLTKLMRFSVNFVIIYVHNNAYNSSKENY